MDEEIREEQLDGDEELDVEAHARNKDANFEDDGEDELRGVAKK
jgi:hypothetical protein